MKEDKDKRNIGDKEQDIRGQQFTPGPQGVPPGQRLPGQRPPVMPGPSQRPPVMPGPGQRPPVMPGPSQRPPVMPGPSQRPPVMPGPGQRPPVMPGPSQRPPVMPGPSQRPPVMPGPSQRPPVMPGPGQGRPGGQPPSAPPRFTPELPREEEQQLFSNPSRTGGAFAGRIIDFRRRPRNFNNCLNRFTYVWMVNGNNFWFYPIDVRRNTIEGFRWRRNRWEYDRINANRVLFHSCF